MTPIREKVAGVTCGDTPISMDLLFNPDHPLAIGFGFVDDDGAYEWWVLRDLVFDGACGQTVGVGDIRLWPAGSRLTGVVLSSNHGEEILSVPTKTLLDFVRRTFQMVPRNREQARVDAALDALLAEVAS